MASARSRGIVGEGFPFLMQKKYLTFEALRSAGEKMDPKPVYVASIRDIVGHELPQERADGGWHFPVLTRRHPDYAPHFEMLDRNFDYLLIHGHPQTAGFDYQSSDIGIPSFYTGYVVGDMPRPALENGEKKQVLISVGGGDYGAAILKLALQARELCGSLKDHPWHFITGIKSDDNMLRYLRDETFELAKKSGSPPPRIHCPELGLHDDDPAIIISRHRDDFNELMGKCVLAVSGAGYNTIAEAWAACARILAIPQFEIRKGKAVFHPEQRRRAVAAREKGLVETLGPRELQEPIHLAQTLKRLAEQPPPDYAGIRTDGAQRSAKLMEHFVNGDIISLATRPASGIDPAFTAAPRTAVDFFL